VKPQAPTLVAADLLAETRDGDGLAVRIDTPPRPVGDRVRHVTAYAAPGVTTRRMVSLLRELADKLEGVP
jgi:hypothetical protein